MVLHAFYLPQNSLNQTDIRVNLLKNILLKFDDFSVIDALIMALIAS